MLSVFPGGFQVQEVEHVLGREDVVNVRRQILDSAEDVVEGVRPGAACHVGPTHRNT